MAATAHRLGLPTDKLASGRTKGETTCNCVKQGKNYPEAGQGCPHNHKKPKTPAAPAQPGAGRDARAAGGKNHRRGRSNRSASIGPKGEDRPRSSTPLKNRQLERDTVANEGSVGSLARMPGQDGVLRM
eukprot:9458054-Pyramimonas_sp.AAC.1